MKLTLCGNYLFSSLTPDLDTRPSLTNNYKQKFLILLVGEVGRSSV